jgi:hypothetical protein
MSTLYLQIETFFGIDNISPFPLPFNLLGISKAFCMISAYPAHRDCVVMSFRGDSRGILYSQLVIIKRFLPSTLRSRATAEDGSIEMT